MGKAELRLWGTKLDYGPVAMDRAVIVPVQPFNYHINTDTFEKEVLSKTGPNGEARPRLYLFFSDHADHKWTAVCELWTVIRDGKLKVETRNLGVEDGWGLLHSPAAIPTFTEVLGDFVVIAGGRPYKPGTITLFGESVPAMSAYIESGCLFVDAELYYDQGKPPLKLIHNHLIDKPLEWDSNFDGSAIEVVDSAGKPRFQLIYHDAHTIFLRGVFEFDNRVVVIEENKMRFAVGSSDLEMKTGPLFEYPSRIHLGQELTDSGK